MTSARGRSTGISMVGKAIGSALFVALFALAGARPARAAEPYVFNVGLLGGIGGPLGADDPDPGTSQRSFELQGNLVTEPRTLLGLRLGKIEFDDADQLGSFHAPELEYVTISGEYRFYKNWYDSGIFLGLGGYRLSGNARDFGGGSHEETAVGLTAGVTGEFEITQHFALLGEITGHYVDLDENNVFATAMGGFSIRF